MDDTTDSVDLIVFLTKRLQAIDQGSQELHKAIRFKLAGADYFTSNEQHKKANSLNRDLGAKNGKHYLLIRGGVVKRLGVFFETFGNKIGSKTKTLCVCTIRRSTVNDMTGVQNH